MRNIGGLLRRLAIAALAALMLSGCNFFDSSVPLQGVASPSQPLQVGSYRLADGITLASGGDIMQLSSQGDGYLFQDPAGDGASLELFVFGPVVGSYVVQVKLEDRYGFTLLQVRNSRELYIADYAIFDAMGRMLFEKLDVPVTTSSSVRQLTDNAALNWALLQELIVTRRDQFAFTHFATWAGDSPK